MGYYTQYEIDASGFENEEKAEFFLFKLNEESSYAFEGDISPSSTSGKWEIFIETDDIKFYDYKDVFRDLSKSFPDVMIEVEGTGEENGDLWVHRFKNGDDERVDAEFKFPDFKRLTE